MRIKIIGDNNCARATRHLLRLAGFAVTEFLPSDAVTHGPHAGYAITIDLAPAPQTPDSHLRPDPPTHDPTSASEEAPRSHRDASSPAFVRQKAWRTTAGAPAPAIHFDSVDSALEAAVLRHVAQLAAAPVVVDRPGGVVHSDRELRIVAPNTGNAKADEAAAVAIEFGVLRGLLDLTSPAFAKASAGKPAFGSASLGKSVPGSRLSKHGRRERQRGGLVRRCFGGFPKRGQEKNGGRLGLCCSRACVAPASRRQCGGILGLRKLPAGRLRYVRKRHSREFAKLIGGRRGAWSTRQRATG